MAIEFIENSESKLKFVAYPVTQVFSGIFVFVLFAVFLFYWANFRVRS